MAWSKRSRHVQQRVLCCVMGAMWVFRSGAIRAQQQPTMPPTHDETKAPVVVQPKLLTKGLTVGFAATVQTPLAGVAKQANADLTSMPYLMLHPGYWGAREATREYCASHWGVGSEDGAYQAAAAVARQTAQREYAEYSHKLGVTKSVAMLVSDIFPDSNECEAVEPARCNLDGPKPASCASSPCTNRSWGQKLACGIATAENVALLVDESELCHSLGYETTEDEVARVRLKNDLIDTLSSWHWSSTERSSCIARNIGFWVGRPSSYDSVIALDEPSQNNAEVIRDREVGPVVAFGVGFTPNSALSLLLGVTYSQVTERDVTDANGATTRQGIDRPLWTLTVGLGGNADLVGVFAR